MADEGMWIPSDIPDSIFKQMQRSGFNLLKKDIYNPDSTSLIDAVPMFGKGCSSAVISPDGLLITNFHCAKYFIQTHSSVTNNLFEKGFTANNLNEELTNPNLTIEFTHKIIDVTEKVLKGTHSKSTIHERDSIISKNSLKLEKIFSDSLHLKAIIEPIFFGNNYLLYLREEFKDIRLVYAPPESIANFGGEKDNWMWPRHCGDFAIFRIYADSTNHPSEISSQNIPYKSKKFLTISNKEKKENDYVMIIGYPGTTEEYLPSAALKTYSDSILPIKIITRKKRLEIMKQYMDSSQLIHLNYNSKYATNSSFYQKWISDKKQLTTNNYSKLNRTTYFVDTALESQLNKAYLRLATLQKRTTFYFEGLISMDIIRFANKLKNTRNKNSKISENIYLPIIRGFYKTYTAEIDRDFFFQIINEINNLSQTKNIQEIISEKKNIKNRSQYEKIELNLYKNSILLDSNRLIRLLKRQPNNWASIIKQDYIYMLSEKVFQLYNETETTIDAHKKIIDSLQRVNITGLLQQKRILYSDANSTLRISFGKIKSYESTDAIKMDFKTTMNGIREKYESGDSNYTIDKKMLYQLLPNNNVCVISTCHTTGGNSGSPMLNSTGQFIGLNFDRNTEGTINDYFYRDNVARNIWVDSAYIIFVLKNYSKATHIVNSLTISN